MSRIKEFELEKTLEYNAVQFDFPEDKWRVGEFQWVEPVSVFC